MKIVVSMGIKIISFGKIDKSSYGDDINRYLKMMKPWCKVESNTLKGKTIANASQKESLLQQEAMQLQKGVTSSTVVCSLAEEGKTMTTLEFSNWITEQLETRGSIQFNFGSAYGLDENLKSESNLLLSLSPMTMPYKLARLVFFEQLYRALSLANNHPYHKE